MPLEDHKTFKHDFLNDDLVGTLAKTGTTDLNEIRLIEGMRGSKQGHDMAKTEALKGGYVNEGRQYFAALKKYQQMPQHQKEKREYYPQVSLSKGGEERFPDLMKIKTKTDKSSNERTRYASFTEFKSNQHEEHQRHGVLQMLKVPELLTGVATSPTPGSSSRTMTTVNKRFTFGFEGMAAVTKFKTVFAGQNTQKDEPSKTAGLLEHRNEGTFIKRTSIRVMNVDAKHL